MYDFKSNLLEDEKIIYEGRPVPGTGSKNIGGPLFIIGFMALMQFLLIWSIVTKTGDGAYGINLSFIIIFLATLLFDVIAIYALLYDLFIKKKAVADDYYCLTNKRAFKYESKKDKLVFGYLINYDDIHCDSRKNGYGDLYMGIVYKETNDSKQDLNNIKDIILNKDPENMPWIIFECIEHPAKVSKLAKDARNELKKSDK